MSRIVSLAGGAAFLVHSLQCHLKKCTGRSGLSNYLKSIADSNTSVAPYSLSIGGRTWTISEGMDRQMVDFLGTWKSPDASARYFRGNPRAVLLIVRKFYLRKDPTREERARGSSPGDHRDKGDSLPIAPQRLE